MLVMTGIKIPPALAVVDGIAGLTTNSAALRPKESPSVLFPKTLTKHKAILSPNPVISNPLAKKNETTINQMTSDVMAVVACPNVSALVKTVVVKARNAVAPVGNGSNTNPVIVDKNMANTVHAYLTLKCNFNI